MQLLIEHGADALIHLGDVGSTGVIDALAAVHPDTGQQIQAHLVFGNTDYETGQLERYAKDLGIAVHRPSGQIEVDGRTIGFTHGHLAGVMDRFLAWGVDYLLHGHTHRVEDSQRGQTRVINPGALFRASRLTAALLTPGTDTLRVLEVASVSR